MFKKLAVTVLLFGLIFGFVFRNKLEMIRYAFSATANTSETTFIIDKKLTVEQLAELLLEKKIITKSNAVIAIGNYKKLTSENIALGKYIISRKTAIRNLLNGFRLNGRGNGNAEVEVDVVVPNVRFIEDLAGKLSKATMIDSASFLQIIHHPSTLKKYGFNQEELPTLFVPNTYKMYYDTDAEQFLERMAMEFKNYWTTEKRQMLQNVGLKSPSEAVTLASIVYSEQSKLTSEWPIIAGLYLNRIRQEIPLQSDPTFKFCWGKELDTVQRLLSVHRNIECAYNTYQTKGLPPGPICIPPLEVVSAVLNPSKHDFIFMVAAPSYSGKHLFANNYSEHDKNAKVFQKWLAGELAKKNK